MRFKIPAVLCLAASALVAQHAAQSALELAQPDAKVLLGVNVRSLRNSSLADSVTDQMRTQMQAPLTMFHVPGIELLDDIDSVFLSSTGDLSAAPKSAAPKTGTAAGAKTAGSARAKADAPFLLALSGTFPDEHLRPLLKGTHLSYKGINVYRGTGADTTSIATLDEHTVLIGDDKSIYRAIDRRSAGEQAQGPLAVRARELASSSDIWIVARDASGELQKASGPAAMFVSEIEGLDMGVAVREGFNMDISVATKTEAGAQTLAQLFSMQMQATISSKLDNPKFVDFWRKVKVGTDGKRMQVQVALTKEELQEDIRLMQEERTASQTLASSSFPAAAPGSMPIVTPARTAVSRPRAPQGPRVVRIYGLDDGVREITLPSRN